MLTDLNISKMKTVHTQNNGLATVAVTNRATSRYLLFNESNMLCGWLNEKTGEQKEITGSKKAFSGIHIISPKIFSLITESGKFSMIDLYLRLCTSQNIVAFDHSNGKLIDVGKPESGALAEAMFS
jgi:N-acetyl-alpha-D-muramate 1-phosphate uridylyltransferase